MDMNGERHLPAPRLEVWRADFDREIDAQAEEAYLANWNRGVSRESRSNRSVTVAAPGENAARTG